MQVPDTVLDDTCPPGFDTAVHVRTRFKDGDRLFYWAALPQSAEQAFQNGLSSERRAFGPEHANQGTATVGKGGWCTIRLYSPRPYIDADTSAAIHRQFHMRRAKRGARQGWASKVYTVVLNPSRKLFRTRKVTYCNARDPRVPSMWVHTEKDGHIFSRQRDDGASETPVLARSRDHAAKLMAQGRVSVFILTDEEV
ncbi:MAG: hypothetical protein CL454_00180 [Acidimicrobiaceae bacterium]|nr:hypothetical protein [Acidimicrobiaceae bacterium]